MMKSIKISTFLFALALIFTLQLMFEARTAQAEPLVTTESLSDGTIRMGYLYLDNEDAPKPENTIYIGKNQYSLSSITKAVTAPDYLRPIKRFERVWTQYIPKEDLNNLNEYFPGRIEIDDGEFVGIIGLSSTTPYTYNDGYSKQIGRVDRQLTYFGLSEGEVDQIPLLQEFEVQSDSEPGAKVISTLELAERNEIIETYDEDGLPSTFTVIATYRGEENYLKADGEEVAAHYVGEVSSNVDQLIVYATYKPIVVIPVPELQIVEAADPFPFWAITAAGSTAVILLVGWLVLWMFVLRKNALLMESSTSQDYYSETLKGRIIKRYKLDLNSSRECIVKLPSNIDPFSGKKRYSIVFKAYFANQSGEIVVVWRDRIISRGALRDIYDIRGREIIESVTSEVLDPYQVS